MDNNKLCNSKSEGHLNSNIILDLIKLETSIPDENEMMQL